MNIVLNKDIALMRNSVNQLCTQNMTAPPIYVEFSGKCVFIM